MKKILIIFSILTVFAVVFIIISNRRSEPWDEWVRRNVPPPAVQQNSPAAIEGVTHEVTHEKETELEPEWEKWVDKQMKMVMDSAVVLEENASPELLLALEQHQLTFEEYLTIWHSAMRAQIAAQVQELKNEYSEPPQEPIALTIEFEIDFPRPTSYIYKGPQTVKALMETFDEKYESPGAVQEMDEKYPREEWLQMFVDNGYDILDHNDYRSVLGLRYDVERVKNDPEQWRSGTLDIPPTDDWETYKAAYIEINASMLQRIHTAAREDPEFTGGFIPHSHPDVFLRYNDRRVYVMRDGLATSYHGRDLTNEQQRNLTHYGVHPEGIEVIYIDKDYNVLNERPPLITPDMLKAEVPSFITSDMLRRVELPPNDWKPPRGWQPPPGLEEALHANGWRGSFAPQEVVPPGVPDIPDHRLVEQTEKAAQDPREQFENAQRELDKFSGMSDAELAAEFEKMLREQFPELPTKEKVESAFREQFETKRLSPERLNRALDILDRHGTENGFQRLREVDPEVAAQIERTFLRPPKEKGPPPRD
ncbi:hypothetical protein J4G08_03675 [Candidatus Poribacteria bacterium]|nr:hypothetical protein [Candidatus Poribacteria bacterium]